VRVVTFEEMEQALRQRLQALHVLRLPDFDGASGSASSTGTSRRVFAELLIDAEQDPYFRAVLVGMLRASS
jgi:hypothetical protein